ADGLGGGIFSKGPLILLLWSVLSGCGGLINPLGLDADGDGVMYAEDCDDADATVGANEQWRDVDGDDYADIDKGGGCLGGGNPVVGYMLERDDGEWDCDDNDAQLHPETIWYVDEDNDDFGDPDQTTIQCEQPAGYLLDDTDCDDTNAVLFPGQVWLLDSDGDGFGDLDSTLASCEEPPGYVLGADSGLEVDCDDLDSETYPGADELCNLFDNDCDGQVDEDNAIGSSIWYRDDDGDGYGIDGDTVLACPDEVGNGPEGYGAFLSGDCDDERETVSLYCPWTDVAVGDNHTCGLRSSGEVECWGSTSGTSQSAIGPELDALPTDFVQISADAHTCGLRSDTSIACWGAADELGEITDTPEGTGFVSVATGQNASCALDEGGVITCWGYTATGVVGDKVPEGSFEFVDVGYAYACALHDGVPTCWPEGGGLTALPTDISDDFVSISAGLPEVCGVREGGSLECFSEFKVFETAPVGTTPAGEDFVQVAMVSDASEACALRSTGEILCWDLDDGSTLESPEGTDFIAVSANDDHACAVREGGSMECWGADTYGQSTPPLDGYLELSAEGDTTCARGDRVECWGAAEGELSFPFSDVWVSNSEVCGIGLSGEVVCWGEWPLALEHRALQIDGYYSDDYLWVLDEDGQAFAVDWSTGEAFDWLDGSFVDITAGDGFGCAVDESGEVHCLAQEEDTVGTTDVDELPQDFTSISADRDVVCGVRLGDGAECWGDVEAGGTYQYYDGVLFYFDGPLSSKSWDADYLDISVGRYMVCALVTDGTIECALRQFNWPFGTPSGDDYFALDSALYHSCALRDPDGDGLGEVVCWGSEYYGEVTDTPEDTDLVAVSTGYFSSCAIDVDGDLSCWGSTASFELASAEPDVGLLALGSEFACTIHESGQLLCMDLHGSETLDTPVGQTASVWMGSDHGCALSTRGDLDCFGDDAAGQASPPSDLPTPTWVAVGGEHTCSFDEAGELECWGRDDDGQASPDLDQPAMSLAAGRRHSCAVDVEGAVTCWGDDTYGQLQAPTESEYTGVFAGAYHSCALDEDGAATCWGLDTWGQSSRVPNYKFTQLALGDEHTCGLKPDRLLYCWGRDAEGQLDSPKPGEE
ncbi:MAG: alpha-tubulin suppressor-like RCC1 family protein, partial [Myxococcota bacterium]